MTDTERELRDEINRLRELLRWTIEHQGSHCGVLVEVVADPGTKRRPGRLMFFVCTDRVSQEVAIAEAVRDALKPTLVASGFTFVGQWETP